MFVSWVSTIPTNVLGKSKSRLSIDIVLQLWKELRFNLLQVQAGKYCFEQATEITKTSKKIIKKLFFGNKLTYIQGILVSHRGQLCLLLCVCG